MNDQRGAIQPGTLLIIVCVVGVFAAAVILAARSGSKRAKWLQEFARSHGWGYSRTDTQGLKAKVEDLVGDQKFSLGSIMTVESGTRKVFLFDCGYSYRDYPQGGNFGTGCLIESDRFQSIISRVEIIARTWVDKSLLSDQIEMGDTEFGRNFMVLSKDPALTSQIVSGSLQTVLLMHKKAPLYNPVRISLGRMGGVILTGYHAEPERWLDLVELARQIESALKQPGRL